MIFFATSWPFDELVPSLKATFIVSPRLFSCFPLLSYCFKSVGSPPLLTSVIQLKLLELLFAT